MSSDIHIYKAPWLFPISHPPVANGAVAVLDGTVVATGTFTSVEHNYTKAEVHDFPESVILPGLINAHIHLELSSLKVLSRSPAPATFTGWIEQLINARNSSTSTAAEIVHEATMALTSQEDDGVTALCDIGNIGVVESLASDSLLVMFCFTEYLGLREKSLQFALDRLQEETAPYCTGHAPYSTHQSLLQELKKRAVLRGHIFPIHVGESTPENDMMSQGRGEFIHFLRQRGFWDGTFKPTGIDKSGSVQYLHQLGLLDSQTLCVHCVHVSDQEIDLLSQSDCKVCLCPGSNRYLGVGKAKLHKLLAQRILPALGTDSLASNPCLSIWREMRVLAEDHPEVDPAVILTMATLGGARALGLNNKLGSIQPGQDASFNIARLSAEALYSRHAVVEALVCSGKRPEIQRYNRGVLI